MLAELLRALRGDRRVEDVAEAIGVVRSAIYLWESQAERAELRRMPRPELLLKLLDYYGATPEQRALAWELRGGRQISGEQGAA